MDSKNAITVQQFCMEKTQVGELVVFVYDGYISGTTYIDIEDLFEIPERIATAKVVSDNWGYLRITTEHGDRVDVPCHCIDYKMED